MYGVAPNDQNRFYLRMLLLHVKGAESFHDLRRYNEITYETYKEAVIARGLLQDDSEWFDCLNELADTHMPRQLREIFGCMCCFCELTSPKELWDAFKILFTEDIREEDSSVRENRALVHTNEILNANGLNCEKLGLPVPTEEFFFKECPTLNVETRKSKGEEMFVKLNDEQKRVVVEVMESVDNSSNNHLFFLSAPGGCGKTFVYTCILNIIRGKNLIALAGAWTGIAALLLDEGTTLHRLFGLPVPMFDSSVSSIKTNSKRADISYQSGV